MYNLYSITRRQEAMRHLFRVKCDLTGNLPSLPTHLSRHIGANRLRGARW
jgi:hypothetical protein